MNQSNEKIIAKLQKILALARRGIGGEKENAQRMLDKLLSKYGMSLADLDDTAQKREQRKFNPKNAHEKKLLVQCVHYAVPGYDGTVWGNKRARNIVWIELTQAEFIEVDLMFETHRKALAKHLKKQAENALLAYIHKNKIYAAPNEEEGDKPSELSKLDLMTIMGMMDTMEPTAVRRAITNGANC